MNGLIVLDIKINMPYIRYNCLGSVASPCITSIVSITPIGSQQQANAMTTPSAEKRPLLEI